MKSFSGMTNSAKSGANKMIVIILSLAPESVKGVVSRYLIEVSTGVFIGDMASNIRHEIWDFIRGNIGKGTGILAVSENSITGFKIETINMKNRDFRSIDGVEWLYVQLENSSSDSTKRSGWSNQSRYLRRGKK